MARNNLLSTHEDIISCVDFIMGMTRRQEGGVDVDDKQHVYGESIINFNL